MIELTALHGKGHQAQTFVWPRTRRAFLFALLALSQTLRGFECTLMGSPACSVKHLYVLPSWRAALWPPLWWSVNHCKHRHKKRLSQASRAREGLIGRKPLAPRYVQHGLEGERRHSLQVGCPFAPIAHFPGRIDTAGRVAGQGPLTLQELQQAPELPGGSPGKITVYLGQVTDGFLS